MICTYHDVTVLKARRPDVRAFQLSSRHEDVAADCKAVTCIGSSMFNGYRIGSFDDKPPLEPQLARMISGS
ncbi:hypothetical protein AGR2A_pa20014 [Agrobacterium genomosp. 2 str. CFBP 5494]|uniref:Uncharacterized protein n=1 Tax=Agrobacterium genomosp. 2 str. CFBP 5494 TaxID=1183436 RepID=A0A9W5F306_9HYPH|nr:hypothetical protein AGR2A_pa20014 [Agrobacterium genomosp. 2 str. CFBP 5494]